MRKKLRHKFYVLQLKKEIKEFRSQSMKKRKFCSYLYEEKRVCVGIVRGILCSNEHTQSEHGCVDVCRSQLEVIPRNHVGGSRPMSTVSAGGSLGRGNRALHLQHHQSSLSALHMATNNTSTIDRRRSSLRVT